MLERGVEFEGASLDDAFLVGFGSSGEQLALSYKVCEFQYEPQSRNRQIIDLRKKWGFRRFQKERPKVLKTTFFCAKSAVLHTFSALFLESAEIPLFAQINYLAISALWLVLKFAIQSTRRRGGQDSFGSFSSYGCFNRDGYTRQTQPPPPFRHPDNTLHLQLPQEFASKRAQSWAHLLPVVGVGNSCTQWKYYPQKPRSLRMSPQKASKQHLKALVWVYILWFRSYLWPNGFLF